MESLRLEICKDDAQKILRHPAIYKTICDDGSPNSEDLCIPEDWVSLVVYIGENPVGCFVLHPVNSISMECHVQVLPEHRGRSREIGEAVIEWVWANTDAQKLTARIPFDCENVKRFAERMGFVVEGINEDSIMKNETILSQWYMGLKKWL